MALLFSDPSYKCQWGVSSESADGGVLPTDALLPESILRLGDEASLKTFAGETINFLNREL